MNSLPQPPPDLLERPIRESTIFELYEAGLLLPQARDAAIESARGTQHWWQWANRSLLFIGTTLTLAGVVFFFAYNWSRINPVAKFCVIEAGLWLCAIGAMQQGLNKITGKVLLLAASVLVGVLLAVYGQVYQTGADDWKVYASWGLLILPWTTISRFKALWILWLAVSNAAWLLCWFQLRPAENFHFVFRIFLLLCIWNSIAIAVRETAIRSGIEWIGGRWARHLILVFCFGLSEHPNTCLGGRPQVWQRLACWSHRFGDRAGSEPFLFSSRAT